MHALQEVANVSALEQVVVEGEREQKMVGMVHYIGCALGHVTKCPAYFIAEFSLPTTAIPAYLAWSEIKPLTSDGAGEQARTARPAQAPQRSTGYGVDVMQWASFEAEKASSWTVQSAKRKAKP